MTNARQWSIQGEYFENCNCEVVCPCITSHIQAKPDQGHCDVVLAFNIQQGNYGDVSLNGLNFVMALTTPGVMSEGNATAALYIDERADPQQREALTSIASGQAGGPPAVMGQAIPVTNFLGVKFVPITFSKVAHQRGASIPGILDLNVEGIHGADEDDVQWLDNVAHPANTRLAVARGTGSSTYQDYDFSWDNTGLNGHFAPINWNGP